MVVMGFVSPMIDSQCHVLNCFDAGPLSICISIILDSNIHVLLKTTTDRKCMFMFSIIANVSNHVSIRPDQVLSHFIPVYFLEIYIYHCFDIADLTHWLNVKSIPLTTELSLNNWKFNNNTINMMIFLFLWFCTSNMNTWTSTVFSK